MITLDRVPVRARLLATAATMLGLLFLSTIPGEDQFGDSSFVWVIETTPKLLQKSLHVGLYCLLTCLSVWSLQKWDQTTKKLLVAVTVAILFGGSMELLQLFVPGRFASLTDVMLNALGALIGCLACVTKGRPMVAGIHDRS